MAQKLSSITKKPEGVLAPLSLAQRRLWFLYQLDPQSPEYNISRAWRLKGSLNTQVLETSLNLILARHDALRTIFQEIDGQPIQVIQPTLTAPFQERDCSSYPPAQLEAEIDRFLIKEPLQPFDLLTGPLLRFTLMRCSPDDHVLVFTVHHMVFDGTSLKNFCQELSRCYAATLAGQPSPLAPLPIQFQDFAYWQQDHVTDEKLASQLAFWKQQLQGAPLVLELPSDGTRPKNNSGPGSYQAFTLAPQVISNLKQLIQPQGITMFMALLAVFQILLTRYMGQRDILVGAPIAGRTHADLEDLMGFFVNTLVLRMELKGQSSFRDVLQHTRTTCLESYRHSDLPFEKIVELLHPVRDPSRHPIVQAIFQLRKKSDQQLSFPELTAQSFPVKKRTGNFDLHMVCEETESGIQGFLYYPQALYSDDSMANFAKHYQILLEGLIANPQWPVTQVPFLTKAEYQKQLIDWNDTNRPYPQEVSLPQLFEAQASTTPEAVAVVSGEQQLTYEQLNIRANQLAHHLQREGVGPEARVGVCLERGVDLIVSLLAILKAGGAYVPLDPSYPRQRIAYLLGDSQVQLLVTHSDIATALPFDDVPVVYLDKVRAHLASRRLSNLPSQISLDSLAYVIYTSGSTGRPKGVLVPHRGLANIGIEQQRIFGVGPGSRVLQFASSSFDASVFELVMAWQAGATLCMDQNAILLPGEPLLHFLRKQAITVVTLPPSALAMMTPESLPGLATITVAGEACPASVIKQWGPGREFFNLYGPTEGTIWSTMAQCPANLSAPPPIGRPIANTQGYVVDQAMQLVPVGVPGELVIGGIGMARGYHHRPDLTAEKFVPHPWSQTPGTRVYQTGDHVRWRQDGMLEFQGRQDTQIKLRGYRIELGEIEVALSQHPHVQETVVVCREDMPSDKQLVAYVTNAQGTLEVSEVRSYLQERLPGYMVPSAFVLLKALPLTLNGKVDKRALPAPGEADRTQGMTYVAPRTPIEQTLVNIWKGILGLEQVGVHDNFFDLGGHSLLATQVVSRVREQLQVELKLTTFFEGSTVAELAESVELASPETGAPSIVPCSREGAVPLSFAQQRLWFLHQLEPDTARYHIPVAVRLSGPLAVVALKQSLQTLVERHESLRTSFPMVEGQPVQSIAEQLFLAWRQQDLRDVPKDNREAAAQALVHDEVDRPFDLATGPMLRTLLVQLADEEHLFVLTLHHIITDGWSMEILGQELSAYYTRAVTVQTQDLPPLPIQYVDFAVWQREWLQGEELARQLTYWQQQLHGAPAVLDLPTDFPRPLVQSFQGAKHNFVLSSELMQQLKVLGHQQKCTSFMTLLAAFQVLLARYTGQTDIVVGSPIANRNRSEIEGLIGFFVNTLVLRTQLGMNPTFREVLEQVREICIDAYAHQDLPFEKLVEELRPERDMARHPLVQILFVLQNASTTFLELPGLQVDTLPMRSGKVTFDLVFSLSEHDDEIQGGVTYKTDLFEDETIVRMIGHFHTLLESIVKNPDQPISALTLLTEKERHELLTSYDAPPTSLWKDCRIHEQFERQVLKNPDKIAVVCEDQQVTYQQLNERANQLAHYLQQCGVKPEASIALHLERSVNMIVGLLGILKAGGCYVPLDPAFPPERLDFMLKDARVEFVLTEKDRTKGWSEHTIQHLCIDDDSILDKQCKEDPSNAVNAENLAYIIFTSGSTGQPKGVGVTHDNVVRLFEQTQSWFHFDEHDTWTVFHSHAFDFSVWELFGALLYGGQVVIVPYWVSRAPEIFYELVINEQVTILNQTPSAFQQFIRAEEAARIDSNLALRFVIFGGEALDFQSLKPWRERHGDRVPKMINMYGITETTVHVTYRPLTVADLEHTAASRIGIPIPDLQVYILDPYQQPVPIGVPGEMYIGGAGVTRGYVNHPELTSTRYIPNPYSQHAGARLYRSGDLARYLPSGDIEYWGRVDHQVKIRGFRIELGEIKTRLVQHPEVREAVVVVREDQLEDKRIVAYLIVADSAALLIPNLRTYLGKWLPNYMIPSAFVILSSLPLTSNGKIDFEKLPVPESSRESSAQPFEQARTPVEEKLANIWREVLNVAQVGIRDNFFDLGGHSLLLTKLANRVHDTFRVRLPLRVIFDLPTIERMGQAIVEEQVKGADKVTVNHFLWKLSEMTPEQVSELLKRQEGEQTPDSRF